MFFVLLRSLTRMRSDDPDSRNVSAGSAFSLSPNRPRSEVGGFHVAALSLPYHGDTHIIRYRVDVFLAAMAVMVYDHAISFDLEIEYIWKLKSPWRLPEYLFLINRYAVPAMLIFDCTVFATPRISDSFCVFFERWQMWPNLLSLATVEYLLLLRVSALFSETPIIGRILQVLFAAECAALTGTVICVHLSTITVVHTLGLLPGCIAFLSAYDLLYGLSLGPLIFETIILTLSIYRVVDLMAGNRRCNATLRVLARDSLLYFLVIFVALLVSVIMLKVSTGALGTLMVGPSNAISCVATGRMLLNMRQRQVPLDEDDEPEHGLTMTTFNDAES